MLRKKKWFPVLLAVMLMLTQVASVFAEAPSETQYFKTVEEAYAAGREVRHTANINWLYPAVIDAEINNAIGALLEATTFRSRSAVTADELYAATAIDMNGKQAVTFDVIAKDDTTYISSPVYGRTVSIGADELPQYMSNLFTAICDMLELDMEEMQPMLDQLSAFSTGMDMGMQAVGDMIVTDESTATEADANEQLMEAFGLTEYANAFAEWVTAAFVPEELEGQMETAMGIEVAKANVYQITKDELVALMQDVLPALLNSEAYWSMVLEMVAMTGQVDANSISMEELMQEVDTICADLLEATQQIPDDILIAFYEGLDEEGVFVYGKVQLIVPGEEAVIMEETASETTVAEEAIQEATEEEAGIDEVAEEEPASPEETIAPQANDAFVVQVEWMADCSFILFDLIVDGDNGIEVISYKAPTEVTATEETTFSQDVYQMIFTVYSDNETDFQIWVDYANEVAESTSSTDVERNTRLLFGFGSEEEAYSIECASRELIGNIGEDLSIHGINALILYTADESIPFVTVEYTVETGDPQGLPFEVEGQADRMVYPGQMDEAAFAEWLNAEVATNTLKTGLFLLSQLPNEVFELIMQNQ